MARREYTQTIRPVSRIAEKIFGWLAWLGLLIIAGGILFFSLVTLNDQAFIDQFTADLQQQLEGQNLEGFTPQELIDATLGLLNSFWMFALYLALPLILGLFGLLVMRRRILAGFLMLLAGLFSAPLVLGVITGLVPLFFIISAILLFVRKDEVTMNDDLAPLDDERGGIRDRREDPNAGPVRRGELDDERNMREDDFERSRELEREREYEKGSVAGDDVRTDRNYRGDDARRDYRDSDIEATRQFNKVDEGEHYRETEANDRYVDGNIDSADTVEPVTEEEYNRTHGIEVDKEARERARRNRDTYDYESDATTERRHNVDRRNKDDY